MCEVFEVRQTRLCKLRSSFNSAPENAFSILLATLAFECGHLIFYIIYIYITQSSHQAAQEPRQSLEVRPWMVSLLCAQSDHPRHMRGETFLQPAAWSCLKFVPSLLKIASLPQDFIFFLSLYRWFILRVLE